MKTKLESQNYLTLDGARGLGAMLVVLGHSAMFWPGFPITPLAPLVDIFFVLSGFVLAFAYEPRFEKGMTARSFMLARVIRLYPLYILGIAMGTFVFLVSSLGDGPNTSLADLTPGLIPAFFMLPWMDPHSEYIYAANVPAWTLFFEMVINLFYVLAYPLLRRTGWLVVVLLAMTALFVSSALHFGTTDIGARWADFWGGFGRVGCTFFSGVLLYRATGRPRETCSRRSLLAIPMVLLLLLYGITLPPGWMLVRSIFLVIAGAPLLVWMYITVQPPRWLSSTFATLGGMSYALYILHYPIFQVFKRLAWRYPEILLDIPALGSFLVLITAMLVSWGAWRWYDEPVRGRINQWLKARRAGTGTARQPQRAPGVPHAVKAPAVTPGGES